MKLIVGEEQKEYLVHRTVISKASPVLCAAFASDAWKEGKERTMTMPEDDMDAFRIFLHYAYVGRLPSLKAFDTSLDSELFQGDMEKLFNLLAKAYCLGEKYQNVGFKNEMIDAIILNTQVKFADDRAWYPGNTAVNTLYAGTCKGSQARKLVVDMYIEEVSGAIFLKKTFDQDFMNEIVAQVLDDPRISTGSSDKRFPWKGDMSLYHEREGN